EGTIASGGMGTVFLGRDQRLNRPVAIKTLRQEIATAVAVQRFIQEAQHLARLNHPHVVRVHDAGEAGDLVYYVMDYVEGETLDARIKRGPLSLPETQKLGRELLSALALAHQNGIVHRDIKPSNVFLSDGRAMLADFGIAHTLDDSTALTRREHHPSDRSLRGRTDPVRSLHRPALGAVHRAEERRLDRSASQPSPSSHP